MEASSGGVCDKFAGCDIERWNDGWSDVNGGVLLPGIASADDL